MPMWRKLVAFAIALTALLSGLAACRALYDPRTDFTSVQRAQFEEAPNMFPKKMLGNYALRYLRWLDDRTLVFSTSLVKGELSSVMTMDVQTGRLVTTKHPGRLDCYADGNIVVGGQGNDFWYGRLGGELENRPATNGRPDIVSTACQPPWYEAEDGSRVAQGSKLRRYTVYPLHKADGILRVPEPERKTASGYEAYLVDAAGKTTRIITPAPFASVTYFAYPGLYGGGAAYFTPTGEVIPRHADNVFLSQIGNISGSGVPMRTGLLWAFNASPGAWQKQGLYFERAGKTYRIDDGYIVAAAGASRDGCLYAYTRSSGNPWDDHSRTSPDMHPGRIELMIVDICKG